MDRFSTCAACDSEPPALKLSAQAPGFPYTPAMPPNEFVATVVILASSVILISFWKQILFPISLILWYLERRKKRLPYRQRLIELTGNLKTSAIDVQLLIAELEQLVDQRTNALQTAETNLEK